MVVSGQKEEEEEEEGGKKENTFFSSWPVPFVTLSQVKLRPRQHVGRCLRLAYRTRSRCNCWHFRVPSLRESWRRISTQDGRDDVVQNVNSIRADTFCNREDISECINEIAPFYHPDLCRLCFSRFFLLFFFFNFWTLIFIFERRGQMWWMIYLWKNWQIIVENKLIFFYFRSIDNSRAEIKEGDRCEEWFTYERTVNYCTVDTWQKVQINEREVNL